MKIILVLFFIFTLYLNAQESIKYTILDRTIQFIYWPENQKRFFSIGVYKNPIMAQEMKTFYKGKTIRNKPIKVLSVSAATDSNDLHDLDLIYFPFEVDKSEFRSFSMLLNNQKVFITSNPDNLYAIPIHIGVFFENQNIRFTINKKLLHRQKINVSHHLLRLSQDVGD